MTNSNFVRFNATQKVVCEYLDWTHIYVEAKAKQVRTKIEKIRQRKHCNKQKWMVSSDQKAATNCKRYLLHTNLMLYNQPTNTQPSNQYTQLNKHERSSCRIVCCVLSHFHECRFQWAAKANALLLLFFFFHSAVTTLKYKLTEFSAAGKNRDDNNNKERSQQWINHRYDFTASERHSMFWILNSISNGMHFICYLVSFK